MMGTVVFFTGLSGSGKTTLANALAERIKEKYYTLVTVLDGDVVRKLLCSDLGFSKEDRDLNIRRIGFVAAEIAKHGGFVICAAIAPYDSVRKEVRSMVTSVGGRFFLVHLNTPLEVCERRDPKGLYQKARSGEIKNFTGVSDPYETPDDAALVLDTTTDSVEFGVDKIVFRL